MKKISDKIIVFLNKKGLLPISDKLYIQYLYKKQFGCKVDFKNPKSFNEKLQWLKIYDRKPIYTSYVDKFKVRNIIREQIGEKYLIPLIGVYDKFGDIDFETLPNQFVIKCNHDSNSVVICKDKKTFDKEKAKEKIQRCLRTNYYYAGREWPYKKVKRKILIEKYMKDEKEDDLIDYKFYVFNGEPKFLYISKSLSNHEKARIDFFDLNFNKMPFYRKDYKRFGNNEIPKMPINFKKMVEFSKKLSKELPFCRIDWYEINKKLFFGEITIYTGSGLTKLYPEEWNLKLGQWLDLGDLK